MAVAKPTAADRSAIPTGVDAYTVNYGYDYLHNLQEELEPELLSVVGNRSGGISVDTKANAVVVTVPSDLVTRATVAFADYGPAVKVVSAAQQQRLRAGYRCRRVLGGQHL